MSTNDTRRRSIRGPEDVDPEVRDEMCGTVTRAALAATGLNCTQRDVDEVAEQLDAVRGVRVSRVNSAEDASDSRDFIDLVLERSASAGQVFLITTRNGFIPETLSLPEVDPGDEQVVLQFKR